MTPEQARALTAKELVNIGKRFDDLDERAKQLFDLNVSLSRAAWEMRTRSPDTDPLPRFDRWSLGNDCGECRDSTITLWGGFWDRAGGPYNGDYVGSEYMLPIDHITDSYEKQVASLRESLETAKKDLEESRRLRSEASLGAMRRQRDEIARKIKLAEGEQS